MHGLVPVAETAVILAGGYVLFRRGYRKILTAGVEDRRFTVGASLPDLPEESIPFERLDNGETLLGKRIRLPSQQHSIEIESGFISTPTGRDLRFRVSPTHMFRSTERFQGEIVSLSILDVTRERHDRIRLSSLHGAALLSLQECADIAQRLAASTERDVVIPDVSYELRSPLRQNGSIDLHFERASSL